MSVTATATESTPLLQQQSKDFKNQLNCLLKTEALAKKALDQLDNWLIVLGASSELIGSAILTDMTDMDELQRKKAYSEHQQVRQLAVIAYKTAKEERETFEREHNLNRSLWDRLTSWRG